jgi:hypothetical protein
MLIKGNKTFTQYFGIYNSFFFLAPRSDSLVETDKKFLFIFYDIHSFLVASYKLLNYMTAYQIRENTNWRSTTTLGQIFDSIRSFEYPQI